MLEGGSDGGGGGSGGTSKRKRYQRRLDQLKQIRSPWDSVHQDIADHILPGAVRLYTDDKNRGERRDMQIYDDAGGEALGTLSSGMMSGASSPARPWYALRAPLAPRDVSYSSKVWLDDLQQSMLDVHADSNTYRSLHQAYEDVAAFGTACILALPDPETVIHHHVIPWGQYCLQQNAKGIVDTFYREFSMSVEQVVDEFGRENCSLRTQQLYENKNYDREIAIVHVIEPRRERDYNAKDALNMPWSSCYFERGVEDEKLLRESGFELFPVLAPRWLVRGGDVYGYGCGRRALGSVRQLQQEQFRKSQAIDFKTDPPKQAPTALRDRDIDMLPGGITFYDAAGPHGGIRSIYEVNLDLQHLLIDIDDVRQRIRRAFFADLFSMMSGLNDTTQRTAAEVAVRQEEKLVLLGPVYTRLQDELFRPLIDLTFHYMALMGKLPPAPPELEGAELSIEFVSVFAQAQRSINTNSIDRFVNALAGVAQINHDVLDKFDTDEWADDYSEMLGVPARMIKSTEDVADLRRARNAMMAQKEQAAAAAQQAGTVKDLASAPTTGPNALNDLMNQYSGYNSPPAQAYG